MIPPSIHATSVGRQFIDLSEELTVAILRTIDSGWELALKRPEMTPNTDEVTMTECLRDAMRSALEVFSLPWRSQMSILPGTESRSQPGMTAPDGRLDIPIFFNRVRLEFGEHDPHAVIECKRVSEGDRYLAREYVVSGIDRFKTGKYAENHSKGFMIGYVLRGTGETAVGNINKYLKNARRNNDSLKPAVFNNLRFSCWQSSHQRQAPKNPIGILHAALLFTDV